jgi:hypothetical protein
MPNCVKRSATEDGEDSFVKAQPVSKKARKARKKVLKNQATFTQQYGGFIEAEAVNFRRRPNNTFPSNIISDTGLSLDHTYCQKRQQTLTQADFLLPGPVLLSSASQSKDMDRGSDKNVWSTQQKQQTLTQLCDWFQVPDSDGEIDSSSDSQIYQKCELPEKVEFYGDENADGPMIPETQQRTPKTPNRQNRYFEVPSSQSPPGGPLSTQKKERYRTPLTERDINVAWQDTPSISRQFLPKESVHLQNQNQSLHEHDFNDDQTVRSLSHFSPEPNHFSSVKDELHGSSHNLITAHKYERRQGISNLIEDNTSPDRCVTKTEETYAAPFASQIVTKTIPDSEDEDSDKISTGSGIPEDAYNFTYLHTGIQISPRRGSGGSMIAYDLEADGNLSQVHECVTDELIITERDGDQLTLSPKIIKQESPGFYATYNNDITLQQAKLMKKEYKRHNRREKSQSSNAIFNLSKSCPIKHEKQHGASPSQPSYILQDSEEQKLNEGESTNPNNPSKNLQEKTLDYAFSQVVYARGKRSVESGFQRHLQTESASSLRFSCKEDSQGQQMPSADEEEPKRRLRQQSVSSILDTITDGPCSAASQQWMARKTHRDPTITRKTVAPSQASTVDITQRTSHMPRTQEDLSSLPMPPPLEIPSSPMSIPQPPASLLLSDSPSVLQGLLNPENDTVPERRSPPFARESSEEVLLPPLLVWPQTS